MSVICQNFVQNAWRKDLCSNCFKSEADHSDPGYRSTIDRGRYVPQATSVYQARVISPGIHWRPLLTDTVSRIQDPAIQDRIACRDFGSQTSIMDKNALQAGVKNLSPNGKGILKQLKTNRKPRRRSSVGFAPEEPLVIGYGGNDYDSDEAAWELGSDDGSINLELLDITDEDRTITKLTKNNTEFNSDNDNLIPSPTLRENCCQTDNQRKINNWSQQYSKPIVQENYRNGFDSNNLTQMNSPDENQDKKLNYYYFSTKTEPPIQNHNHIEQVNYLNQCKEMSLIAKDIPGIIHNIQNNNTNKDSKVETLNKINNCSITNSSHQKEMCHQQNLSKYLLITKISDNGEGSSDSDYSTSKQTNGESSTDTDSFHDAEEAPMIPCSSFLHGKSNLSSTSPQSDSRIYATEKPFETSSVSSGDTSTLSDDSDFHNPGARKTNKTKAHSNKASRQQTSSNVKTSSPEHFVNISTNSHTDSKMNCLRKECHTPEFKTSINTKPTGKSESSYGETKSSKTDTKAVAFQNNNIPTKSIAVETQGNKIVKPAAELHKHVNYSKELSNKAVHFSGSESKSTTYQQSHQERNNKVPEIKQASKKAEPISTHLGSQDSKTCKFEDLKNSNISLSETKNNGEQTTSKTAKEPQINRKVKTSPEASRQSTNGSKIHSDVHEERQKSLTECKSFISSADEEWKSVKHIKQSTPSVSSSNTDSEDRHFLNEVDHIEKGDPDSNQSSARSSPNSKLNRQNKLAALAMELEKVRCDSKGNELKTPSHPPPPETPKYSPPKAKPPPQIKKTNSSVETTQPTPDTSGKYPSIRRGRSIASAANMTKLASLPDLLPDTAATKLKKGRFSLKKLLKRGKDSDTLVINGSNENNQKAWKRQTFDRSRLSLEIVHPMDLTSDSQTSNDSTPTEERNHHSIFMDPSGKKGKISRHNSGALRARSLSALPQLTSCVFDTSDAVLTSGVHHNMTTDVSSASLDRTRLDMPRKAGTVAERSKKYKAPRRTPSFSELRTSTPSSVQPGIPDGSVGERPPKPPPPPRGKSLPPPLPPTAPPQSQIKAQGKNTTPARPPPPKSSDGKENGPPVQVSSTPTSKHIPVYVNGDYANLGDIRLHITPKKPGRPSAVSFARDPQEMDTQDITENNSSTVHSIREEDDNTYETLEAQEEEDHYTYLDDAEGKIDKKVNRPDAKTKNSTQEILECANGGDKPPKRLSDDTLQTCESRESLALKKPWLDLQASYAAIAAANYESLAEFITTAISENLEKFQKNASSLKWNDFNLETEEPIQVLEDKLVYNAMYKIQSNVQVTLMLTTQKQHTTQSCRNTTRPPVLASFSDCLPRKYIDACNKQHSVYSDATKVMVYVLQRSRTSTVHQFAENISSYNTNQHIHLRNACFVLLQLIHTLKSLQADGIEEIDYDLDRIMLLHTDVDKAPILVLLPGDKAHLTMSDFYKADVATRKTTLCQTTLQLLFHLLCIKNVAELNNCVVNGEFLAPPVAHTFEVISKVLSEEKASSLTQAKGLLEYMLWGPVDIKSSDDGEDVDVILQRWLDLQRAQMVKSIISNLYLKINSHTGFHVYEEYQLIFLLQATVKSLKDIIMKL